MSGKLSHLILTPSPTVSGGTLEVRSPNCLLVLPSPVTDVAVQHRGVMQLIETWINICSTDLECSTQMKKETKDFFNKMASLGPEYKAWSHRQREKLKLEVLLVVFK